MKYLIILMFVFATFSANAYEMCVIPQHDIVYAQGCCSHHDGVCGCSYGRTQCCDGTISSSCSC